MSIRQFAAHLGLNDAAIAQWEQRGEKAQLRYETQQLLDLDLDRAVDEVKTRFSAILRLYGEERLGASSAARTRALLDILLPPQVPDGRDVDRFRQFLSSASRVFVVTGIPGSVVYHLARTTAADADYQIHLSNLWAPETCLSAEVLRYAGTPPGDDSLLTLERVCATLRRPCLIVLDGIDTRPQLDRVGRQVEAALRQVLGRLLRFVLIIRTLPDLDLSAYPVLAASIYEPSSTRRPRVVLTSTRVVRSSN